MDSTLRDLATTYEMSDIRSARAGESAMPKSVNGGRSERRMFAGGWGIDVNLDQNGRAMPTCAPAGITSKVTAEIGKVQPSSGVISGPRPMIEARHKAQIPRG